MTLWGGQELSSQPVPAEDGAGEVAIVEMKVGCSILGSVGKEENQEGFYVTL